MQLRRILCLILVALCACSAAVDDTAPGLEEVEQAASAPTRSLEVGTTLWGTDHAVIGASPTPGVLFSVWTRIPNPGRQYPWNRGNLDVWVLRGETWHLRCLVGNSSARSPSEARYSANTMLFADPDGRWAGDYGFFESDFTMREAPVRDWVWVAWHVVVDRDSFAIRQWLKFGVTGEVFAAGESDVTFDEVRQFLRDSGQPDDFTPSPPKSMQVGSDHGYLTQARVERRTRVPRLDELEKIARGQAAVTTAWAQYPLVWKNGAPDLSDVSGHRRNLSLAPGGALKIGLPGPRL